MLARLLPLLVLVVALAACDNAADTSGLADVWEGTARFRADTVLAAQNYRVTADYDVDFRFTVTQEDGLAWGTVEAAFSGMLVAREAGRPADTLRFERATTTMSHDAFGTFIRPTLELDVPLGPYEDDLWTFTVVGGRGTTGGQLKHTWTFTRLRAGASPVPFDFTIASRPAPFQVRRTGTAPAQTPEGSGGAPTSLRLDAPALRAVLAQTSAGT